MSNSLHHRVGLGHPTTHFANLSNIGLASAASPILSFAPILSPSVLYSGLQAMRYSRLTHIGQPIQHVLTWRPVSTSSVRPPMKAVPPGYMSANKTSAALPQQTLTVIKFAPRRLSEEFVECLRVMAESVIKGSRLHILRNDQPPEMTQTSFATFYLSPYFVKFLPMFDNRIRGDSEWFSSLDDIQPIFSQETLPEQRFTPHLIAQIYRGKLSPRARRALHNRAQVQRQGKEVLLRQLLAPEGLLLASGESDLHQRIRFGKQWVKDQHGKLIELRPDELPFRWFVRWLVQRAHHHVEGILLDRAVGALRSDLLETNRVDFGGFATEIVDRHPEAGVFAPSPEALLEAQTLIAALGRVASPRERELLFLLLDGAAPQEAAEQLGIKRATVDVLSHRLKRKLHAL
jgi:DNA-directed RNA polymerase specialized sigma24 family protein